MRLALLASLLVFGCGGGSSTPAQDLSVSPDLATNHDLASNADLTPAGPTLTVENTLEWCTVTVTVGNAAPVMFATASKSFPAPAGTTVTLSATPNATFMPVKWTGVTTMSGSMATYTMTSAAMQSVTACCATSTGSGC